MRGGGGGVALSFGFMSECCKYRINQSSLPWSLPRGLIYTWWGCYDLYLVVYINRAFRPPPPPPSPIFFFFFPPSSHFCSRCLFPSLSTIFSSIKFSHQHKILNCIQSALRLEQWGFCFLALVIYGFSSIFSPFLTPVMDKFMNLFVCSVVTCCGWWDVKRVRSESWLWEKKWSLVAPGTQTRVSVAPGFSVGPSTHWAIAAPPCVYTSWESLTCPTPFPNPPLPPSPLSFSPPSPPRPVYLVK